MAKLIQSRTDWQLIQIDRSYISEELSIRTNTDTFSKQAKSIIRSWFQGPKMFNDGLTLLNENKIIYFICFNLTEVGKQSNENLQHL